MTSTTASPWGRPFAAVLFDMDGTLVDSSAAITRSWTTWALESGIGAEELRAAHGHGRPAAEIVRQLVGGAGVDGHVDEEAVARASARIDALEVADVDGVVQLPGVAALLDVLPPHRWAVVTSCGSALAAARMRAGALPVPGALVTFDDVERGKPDPACFLLGARRLGVDPADCLVVEDAPAGLAAARAAGCATLAVRTTHPTGPLDADVVVDRLSGVRATVDERGVHVTLGA
ncbi:HAD-IA family hydrolase [Kineococcus sp. SYSU DK004]|uniref:HAD-IA family hydrolase n=1 Tax=Kineococcus sp. SYSU DK004 TaxID=3383125 RepID=UPI003D7E489E